MNDLFHCTTCGMTQSACDASKRLGYTGCCTSCKHEAGVKIEHLPSSGYESCSEGKVMDLFETRHIMTQKNTRTLRSSTPHTKTKRTLDAIQRNKFYVGSSRALDNSWGHPTLAKALKHAEEVMEEQDLDSTFVVQIVRVVRRKRVPAEVVKV